MQSPALPIAVVVVALFAGFAPAADIPSLVAKLSADDYRERERAGAALVALGHQAVPDLKAALAKSADPEATRRLEVLVERLESASFSEPTRITLKVEQKPGREVFDELARQSGATFHFSKAPRGALVSFDWRGTPLLQTLDQLCGVLRLNWWIEESTHLIVVSGGDVDETHDTHVTYRGPFRVCADSIALKRELRLSSLPRPGLAPPPPGLLAVVVSVQSEPRLPICAVGPPLVLAAGDELGNSLLLANRDAESLELPTPLVFGHHECAEFTLNRASRLAESVKACRVRVPVGCVTARLPEIVVADVAKSQGQRFTGRTNLIEVGDSFRYPDHLAVNIVASNKDTLDPDGPAHRSWRSTLPRRFEAFDEEGRALQLSWFNVTDTGSSLSFKVKISRVGGGRPKAVKLHFVEWAVKYQTVEFAFKDLPLP